MSYNIKVKRLSETAKLPTQGSLGAAGWDVYADIEEPLIIQAGETKKVPTGLAFELPTDVFLGIYPRSGLATKGGVRLANCVGILDSDYRGQCYVALHNDSQEAKVIVPNDRIAQVIFQPYIIPDLQEVDELSETARGEGGFGSTGE